MQFNKYTYIHTYIRTHTHIEKRLNKRPLIERKQNDKKTLQSKTNVTPGKDATRHHMQTKKRAEDTSSLHLRLIFYGEQTSTSTLCFGFPPLGPSRHVRAYFCHETSRPLSRHLAPLALLMGQSRPLVSVDTESSEVVEEIFTAKCHRVGLMFRWRSPPIIRWHWGGSSPEGQGSSN